VDNLARLKADSNANCRSVSVYVVVPDHRMESTVSAARQIKRDDALIANRSHNRLVRPNRVQELDEFIGAGRVIKSRKRDKSAGCGQAYELVVTKREHPGSPFEICLLNILLSSKGKK
jgi:hypothetical protein